MVLVVKNPAARAGDIGDLHPIPGSGRPLEGARQPTPVLLPGESHGQRSLAGYRPWGCRESDTTEYFASVACLSTVYSPFLRAWMNVLLEQKEVAW